MSVILRTFCTIFLQITLLLSILFLLRGHNYPGGGFIGALIACTGFGFHVLAYDQLPDFFKSKTQLMLNTGIAALIMSLLAGLLFNKNPLTGLWLEIQLLGSSIKLGTPLLFDIGVYFVITGSILWILTLTQSN